MNYIKRLLRSRTIQGIVAAAIGGVVGQIHNLLTPELLTQFGPILDAVSGLAQAGGLSWATYGRIKATAPLTPPSPSRGEGDR